MEGTILQLTVVARGPKDVTWEFGGSIGSALPEEKRYELMVAMIEVLKPQFEKWDRDATKFN